MTVSINSKTRCNQITAQLSITDQFKEAKIAPLTTSTYASWSVEMEGLLRPKGLWKFAQVLAHDFMTTLGTLTLKGK